MDGLNTTPPADGMPVVGRPILDANIGLTNRIEHDDICEIMINTFNDIAEVLSDHCGPYGQFAMVTTPNNKVAEPVFTKDGIGIVRAMEYMSPMEEFVRTTLAYIGSRIETAAGDGTTSSMIICATGLASLMSWLQSAPYAYTYTKMIDVYNTFVASICKLLNENKYTIDRLQEKYSFPRKELIRRVAYNQAFTSSHGNAELSEAVASLFEHTPEQAWGYMYIDKCAYETDKTYQVEIDDTQYTVSNVRIWPTSALTENLGTKRIRENGRIIISGVAPANGYEEGRELLKRCMNAIESNEDVAILCPNAMDAATTNQLSTLMDEHPNHKVVFFFLNDTDPRLNDIVCIKALCNDFDLSSEKVVSYIYENGDLKITKGLYKPSANKLNPMIGNPEYKGLNTLVDEIDRIIKQIKSEVSSRVNNQSIARLQKFRMKLTVSKRSYFLIGGNAYDNAAAVDVVVDAILAVKNTLSKGFGLGGNKTLYKTLKEYSANVKTSKDITEDERALLLSYANLFMDGIAAVHRANTKWFNTPPAFDENCSFDLTKYVDNNERDCKATIEDVCMAANNPTIITQPITADMELVKRFGELALKFVRTQRIITPGGVCTLSQKNKPTTQNP